MSMAEASFPYKRFSVSRDVPKILEYIRHVVGVDLKPYLNTRYQKASTAGVLVHWDDLDRTSQNRIRGLIGAGSIGVELNGCLGVILFDATGKITGVPPKVGRKTKFLPFI